MQYIYLISILLKYIKQLLDKLLCFLFLYLDNSVSFKRCEKLIFLSENLLSNFLFNPLPFSVMASYFSNSLSQGTVVFSFVIIVFPMCFVVFAIRCR